MYVVCLNRDCTSDVAAPWVIYRFAPVYVGMMGSRKRIDEVRVAMLGRETELSTLHAPVGLVIDAQSPHEIAVSILVQARRRSCRLSAQK